MPGRKAVALCLVIAVMNLYSMRALGSTERAIPIGDLTALGQVTVNGEGAISGTSVFTDSEIVTAPDSTASLSLGKLGQVVLLERSDARVGFGESVVTGDLGGGSLRASVPEGVAARVVAGTLMVTSDPQQEASFVVERDGDAVTVRAQAGKIEVRDGDKTLPVAAGESYAAGSAAPQSDKKDDDNHHKKDKGLIILLGIGAAIAAIVFVLTRSTNSSTQFGGGNVGPSPSR
jgi:ferric-dicitrate binding protein FerR (iron transport regulator)